MDRVQQGLAVTIYADFLRDGTGEDPSPDSATVTVTRQSTGTALYTDAAAIDVDDPAGRFGYTLSPTDTALLDVLTLDWTVTFDSIEQTARTVVEVVGGFLFSLSEFTTEVSDATSTYTLAQMAKARTYAETQLEKACGQAFVPRYTQETLSGDSGTTLNLRWPHIRTIRSVTVDAAAYTVDQLANVAFSPYGILTNTYATWPLGGSNIVVGYEHGLSVVDPGASEAALVLAKHKLVRGPIDERATQRTSEFGPVNLATPGMFGSRFGIPVVDAFVQNNDMNVGVA